MYAFPGLFRACLHCQLGVKNLVYWCIQYPVFIAALKLPSVFTQWFYPTSHDV